MHASNALLNIPTFSWIHNIVMDIMEIVRNFMRSIEIEYIATDLIMYL